MSKEVGTKVSGIAQVTQEQAAQLEQQRLLQEQFKRAQEQNAVDFSLNVAPTIAPVELEPEVEELQPQIVVPEQKAALPVIDFDNPVVDLGAQTTTQATYQQLADTFTASTPVVTQISYTPPAIQNKATDHGQERARANQAVVLETGQQVDGVTATQIQTNQEKLQAVFDHYQLSEATQVHIKHDVEQANQALREIFPAEQTATETQKITQKQIDDAVVLQLDLHESVAKKVAADPAIAQPEQAKQVASEINALFVRTNASHNEYFKALSDVQNKEQDILRGVKTKAELTQQRIEATGTTQLHAVDAPNLEVSTQAKLETQRALRQSELVKEQEVEVEAPQAPVAQTPVAPPQVEVVPVYVPTFSADEDGVPVDDFRASDTVAAKVKGDAVAAGADMADPSQGAEISAIQGEYGGLHSTTPGPRVIAPPTLPLPKHG